VGKCRRPGLVAPAARLKLVLPDDGWQAVRLALAARLAVACDLRLFLGRQRGDHFIGPGFQVLVPLFNVSILVHDDKAAPFAINLGPPRPPRKGPRFLSPVAHCSTLFTMRALRGMRRRTASHPSGSVSATVTRAPHHSSGRVVG